MGSSLEMHQSEVMCGHMQLTVQLLGLLSVSAVAAKPPLASKCSEKRQQVAALHVGTLCHFCCAGLLGMELCQEATHKCSLLPTQRPQPASVPTKTEINMEPWIQYKRQPKDFHLSLPFLLVSPPRVYFRSPMCQMPLGTRKKLGDLNWPWFHGVCNLVRETLATYVMALATAQLQMC